MSHHICAPIFMSSDWSTPVFVSGHVTNVMHNASKIYVSEGKTEIKSWEHKIAN